MYEMYEEYELEGIWDNTVFVKESEADHLLTLDLPSWCDNRNTWEPALAVNPIEDRTASYPDQSLL